QRPVPERDRPRAPPSGRGRAEEEATERVVERTRDGYETARARMVEEQLVQRGVTDERVLAAMRRVPRHLFVEEPLRDRAHGDHPLPIGEEQTISQPYIVGLMSDRKSTRLNSSHLVISYAVFCLKKKKT